MTKKSFFSTYFHTLIYFFSAIVFSFSLDYTMLDDGLRHISFSINEKIMNNWGEVFPHSLFNEYDPWFLWHKFIYMISMIVDFRYIHIVINGLSLFILMILIDFHIRKNSKYDFSSIFYLIVISIVYLVSNRYIMVRPDLLSGIYVLAALFFTKRVFFLFLITVIYGPFYYLFFLYTGSVGLVYLVQKNIRAFFSIFLGSVVSLSIHLIYDFDNYLYTVKNILLDQQLRMGLEVGEGKPLFEVFGNLNYFVLLPIFLILSFLLIYKYYNFFKENQIALFLLITSILWLNQVRYYLLFFPLFAIFLFTLFVNIDKKKLFKTIRKYFIIFKRYLSYSKKVKFFYMIAIPYTIFALAFSLSSKSVNEKIDEALFFKNEVFNNKIILLNRLNTDLYKALYHNPTLKFVPSCSVGWFDNKNPKIKDIYIRMQKKNGVSEEELSALIKFVNADFYIHYTQNEMQVLNFEKLSKLGIIPLMIYHNRIIFKIEKKNE